MNFNIHDVKDVCEVFNQKDARDLLSSGWTLLAVCPINNGETSDRCYIFGTCDLDDSERFDNHDNKQSDALTKILSILSDKK